MAQTQSTTKNTTEPLPGPKNRTAALLLVSVLGLFLELMLIRWIGTEIRIFAYLQNTVLVVCFLGLGMGCFTCRRQANLRDVLLPFACLVLILAVPISRRAVGRISELLSALGDLTVWHRSATSGPLEVAWHVALGLVLTLLLMVLIWEMFVPIGRILGRLLDEHPHPIWGYSVNIAGSLAGIWLFVLLSALYQPPLTWCAVAAVMLLFFLGRNAKARRIDLGLLAGIVLLSFFAGREPDALDARWSPYQKLVLTPRQADDELWPGNYLVTVNNTGYQAMIDLSDENLQANPDIFPAELHGLSQYDIPAMLHPDPQNVLIVGAGSGNDVAGALRNGARRITAVEIDPAIIAMGRRFHPEKPYDAPRVRVVNDDARAFFATADEKYDLISFGLLDSHTTTAMTNARLDHYVYTRESLQRAKSLLADGGVIVLSFEAEKTFISDRMAGVIREVFGEEPFTFVIPPTSLGWGGVMFVSGDLQTARAQIARNPRLVAQIADWQARYPLELPYTTRIASDDWPYIYLRTAHIPTLYFLLAGLMIVLFLRGAKRLQITDLVLGFGRTHWHFFFLGAAFLLLEVQNISKASVALGNTWSVNAVIISGILAMILVANWIAARFPTLPLAPVYAGLCGTCLALYFVDLSQFAFLAYAAKAALIGALTTLPMLFSGIIFIRSFTAVAEKDKALGANLMGALVGGMLQSVTFVTGIKALLLIVAALYTCACLTRPRRERADARSPEVAPEPEQAEPEPEPALVATES